MEAKYQMKLLAMLAVLLFTFHLGAQESASDEATGLAGDHFSLEGALELFKKAESPEDFEKLLNTESSNVNNLDLDEDGETDYVRVVDNMDGDVHALVLQVPVSEDESQDIAVIEIEKTGDEEAILQIVGDEDIYGEQIIVEPFDMEAKQKGKGPAVELDFIVVNVWGWPSVRFVYAPAYRPWASPWRFRMYPRWWAPWRVVPFAVWHPRIAVYRPHYHVVATHRVVRAHAVYTPHRRTSKVVHTRTTTVVKNRNGQTVGKRTTTRTTVKGKNGGQVTRKKTTSAHGRKGRRGN